MTSLSPARVASLARASKRTRLEDKLCAQLRALGVADPVREHRFHPVRRWRFDLAWPDRKLAVEVDGGTWSAGRHVRGAGYERDAEKFNAAALLGWTVLHFTGAMVRSGEAAGKVAEALR